MAPSSTSARTRSGRGWRRWRRGRCRRRSPRSSAAGRRRPGAGGSGPGPSRWSRGVAAGRRFAARSGGRRPASAGSTCASPRSPTGNELPTTIPSRKRFRPSARQSTGPPALPHSARVPAGDVEAGPQRGREEVEVQGAARLGPRPWPPGLKNSVPIRRAGSVARWRITREVDRAPTRVAVVERHPARGGALKALLGPVGARLPVELRGRDRGSARRDEASGRGERGGEREAAPLPDRAPAATRFSGAAPRGHRRPVPGGVSMRRPRRPECGATANTNRPTSKRGCRESASFRDVTRPRAIPVDSSGSEPSGLREIRRSPGLGRRGGA